MKPPESSTQVIEIEKFLVQQTQWIVERYENVNEGIMTRAASLAGFAGVELSLVGQMVVTLHRSDARWGCAFTYVVFSTILLTVIFLLASIFLFLEALTAKSDAPFPDQESISEIIKFIEDNEIVGEEAEAHKIARPLAQLLMRDNPDSSYANYLKKENNERGQRYKQGRKTLIASQILLGLLVLVIFWR